MKTKTNSVFSLIADRKKKRFYHRLARDDDIKYSEGRFGHCRLRNQTEEWNVAPCLLVDYEMLDSTLHQLLTCYIREYLLY